MTNILVALLKKIGKHRPAYLTYERTNGDDTLGTPAHILDAVRKFAARKDNGQIDLDPASDAEHNKIVKATRIFTVEDDGLSHLWEAKFVWCNPPFGTVRGKSRKAMWFAKAVSEYEAGRVKEGIVLLTSSHDAKWFRQVIWWPRIQLHEKVDFRGAPGKGGSPRPITLVYLGTDQQAFFDHFLPLGQPVPPMPPLREQTLSAA